MARIFAVLVAAVSLIAQVPAADAADVLMNAPVYKAPVPATAYSWTGLYIGANIGGGWGSRSVNYVPNDPASISLFSNENLVQLSQSLNTSGVLGGLQLGYNWQLNRNWLVGFETDFDWSGMKGSASNSFGTVPIIETADEHIKWFGTVRARLGYLPMDNLLAYVTGGFAYGQVAHTGNYVNASAAPGFAIGVPGFSVACFASSTCFAGSSSKVAAGWTLGGGFEYAFWQKWSLKAEYLYVSLGSTSVTESASVVAVPGDAPASFNANFSHANFNVARVGLNYRF